MTININLAGNIVAVDIGIPDLEAKLDAISAKLDKVLVKENQMEDTTKKILKDLDDATNGIAARLQKLQDTASQQGQLSAAEINAALTPEVARLQGLAADPTNVVPAPPIPAPTPAPTPAP